MRVTELERLTQLYADAGDEEIREALRQGPEAYRPEAWQLILAESLRRGLRRRSAVRSSGKPAPQNRYEWTPGLLVGLVAAGAVAIWVFRLMVRSGGGRGVLQASAAVFLVTWFGVALAVDWRRWWPGQR